MVAIPAGFIESTFVFRCEGITRDMTWSCGWDCANFGTLTAAQMAQEIRGEFSEATTRPYAAANMIDSYTFVGVSVVKMLEDGPSIGQDFTAITGTATTDALPPNCAFLMNKNTASGGRRNRGRAFIPILTPGEASTNAAGVVDNGVVSAVTILYGAARVALVALGYDPVLFHQTPPYTPTPITSFSFSSLLATQRRRMRS